MADLRRRTVHPKSFEFLSIADYTLVCQHQVLGQCQPLSRWNNVTFEALVIVDQISYNTTYNIDLGGPGASPVTTTQS